MSLGNRKPCDYCWLGPVCKVCSFDLFKRSTEEFLYQAELGLDEELLYTGSSPLDVDDVFQIKFDINYLTIKFTNCNIRRAFTKIFPAGSQAVFYYSNSSGNRAIYLYDGYEYNLTDDLSLIQIPINKFILNDQSTYDQGKIMNFLNDIVLTQTEGLPFKLRFCTSGEQFNDS